MRYLIVLLVLLLMLPALPVAAQERCVANRTSNLTSEEQFSLAQHRADLATETNADGRANLLSLIRALEAKDAHWAISNGVGNGWIADGPNTCVLHYDSSGAPVYGTRLYLYGSSSTSTVNGAAPAANGVGQQAVVTTAAARIRSGPGLQHDTVGLCGSGMSLTVWTPAQGGWLQASCFGANGWIYASLVSMGAASAPATAATGATGPAPAAVSGSGQSAVVTNGPARIRTGPGMEHDTVGLCGIGWSLTVWSPGQGGWLQASCYGANGWIYQSLVNVSG